MASRQPQRAPNNNKTKWCSIGVLIKNDQTAEKFNGKSNFSRRKLWLPKLLESTDTRIQRRRNNDENIITLDRKCGAQSKNLQRILRQRENAKDTMVALTIDVFIMVSRNWIYSRPTILSPISSVTTSSLVNHERKVDHAFLPSKDSKCSSDFRQISASPKNSSYHKNQTNSFLLSTFRRLRRWWQSRQSRRRSASTSETLKSIRIRSSELHVAVAAAVEDGAMKLILAAWG